MYTHPDSKKCPPQVVEALENYIYKGIPPGDFIRALLENNLLETFKQADVDNVVNLHHIVAGVYELARP